jgi:4'-phosphopantetheinyl transferase
MIFSPLRIDTRQSAMSAMLGTPGTPGTPGTSAEPCRLWRIDLDQPVDAAARAALSPEEVARAGRFVFARDRDRYVAAHAALRHLLAASADEAPRLRFAAGPFGKPRLAGRGGAHFNLSHSQGVALVAISAQAEVGVDVEVLRPMPDAQALAGVYFTQAEQQALAACHARGGDAARDRAFLVCWSRKEACLKALGTGLELATCGFEVGVDDLAGAVRDVSVATALGVERLRLQSFEAAPDAVGALALRPACADASPATLRAGATAAGAGTVTEVFA